MRACGLDFGTSNSAIGVMTPGAAPSLVPLESGGALLPSAIFFDFEQSKPLFGAEAIDAYTGGAPGRLMRALKSVLASPLIKDATRLQSSVITFEQIVGLFVREMKRRAETALGKPLDAVVHGRPVHFVDGDEAGDRYAEDTLKVIAQTAGFREVSFAYEPIAAARAYELTLDREAVALICDIGGGTSDYSVIRLGPSRRAKAERKDDILANFGIRLGGTDLDRLLSMDAAMPFLGFGSMLIGKDLPMPRGIYAELATWSRIHTLYTPANRRMVTEALADAREPVKIARLKAILDRQLGHRLALAVESAKIALSATDEAPIAMDYVEKGLAATATRDRFDDAVHAERARMADAVRETLKRSGLGADGVDTVFLTGGSSRVPAFRKAIGSVISPNKFAAGDDMLSVALGLSAEAGLRYA